MTTTVLGPRLAEGLPSQRPPPRSSESRKVQVMNSTFSAGRVDGDDDLARQRRKRAARELDRPVPEDPEMTLRDVVRCAISAIEEAGDDFEACQFLAARGHTPETIEAVMAQLDLHHPDHPS